FRWPVTRMQTATGSLMYSLAVEHRFEPPHRFPASRIEQMEDTRAWVALIVHAEKAVPECRECHRRRALPRRAKLLLNPRKTLRAQIEQRLRIGLHSSIRRGNDVVGKLFAKTVLLGPKIVEQERAHARSPYIETHNERFGIGLALAGRRNHLSL